MAAHDCSDDVDVRTENAAARKRGQCQWWGRPSTKRRSHDRWALRGCTPSQPDVSERLPGLATAIRDTQPLSGGRGARVANIGHDAGSNGRIDRTTRSPTPSRI